METRATWGAGYIAGLGPKVLEANNQADEAYALAIPSALGVEKNKFSAIFKEKSTVQARETIVNKTGIGFFSKTSEGKDYNSDDRVNGYAVQLNPQKFTNGIEITEEERDDMDFDLQAKMDEQRDIKIAYMQTVNRDAFSIINNSQTAQASLPDVLSFYADGVPFASTIHPIKATTTSNTTQSNASATGIVYSEANQETGRLALRAQHDDKDLPQSYGSGNITLLVPDALEKNAIIVNKSTLRSGTGNNDMNIYDGIVTVMSTKWINSDVPALGGVGGAGSDTRWTLFDSMKSPLLFINRQAYRTNIYQVNSNKNIVTDASARYQVGNRTWRGGWVSAGDTNSYSS